MNKLEEIKSLYHDENILVLTNNQITLATIPAEIINNTIIFEGIDKLKIFYLLDQNTIINFHFKSDIDFSEIFYDIKNDVILTQNYEVDRNINVHIVDCTENNTNFTRKVNTILKEGSYTKIDNLYISSDNINVDYMYDIVDSYVALKINNAIVNDSGKIQNYNFNVKHNQASSQSEMITYAISKNSSLLNVNTDGVIVEHAVRTTLNQKTKGVILDDESQISANPILEIDEYDVIASHGASIGAIDDEELYYLMSRGLTKEVAERMIINGLMYPFLNSINDDLLSEYIKHMIDKHL
ncbi:MAG: SufB/SufD family protein [Bacilli bacterium]